MITVETGDGPRKPKGRVWARATVRDADGNVLRVIEQSTDGSVCPVPQNVRETREDAPDNSDHK